MRGKSYKLSGRKRLLALLIYVPVNRSSRKGERSVLHSCRGPDIRKKNAPWTISTEKGSREHHVLARGRWLPLPGCCVLKPSTFQVAGITSITPTSRLVAPDSYTVPLLLL